jgi:hypothetical protein
MVEIAITPPIFGLRPFIRNDGRGFVPLVHLDALRIELRLLEVECCLSSFAGSDALRTGIAKARDARRYRVLRALDSETGVQRSVVEPRLVGPQYDLSSDGRPLQRIALQKFRAGPATA